LDAPGFREQIEKLFAANDRDGDGVITSGEYDDPSD
jgi:Ca2+-binding EF-hand superfamily protein